MALGAWSARLLLGAGALAVAVWIGVQVQLVLVALFLGLVLTAVLRPLATFYRRHVPAAAATVLSLLSLVAAVGVLVVITTVGLAGSWYLLLERLETGIVRLSAIGAGLGLPVDVDEHDVEALSSTVLDLVGTHGPTIAGHALGVVGTAVTAGMVVALGVFCAVCFLTGGERMWAWFVGQLPRGSRPAWRTAGEIAWSTFGGYTRGSVLAAVAVGGLGFAVLVLLGVPLAAPLGVLVFIGAFVPLIGAPGAMVVAMLVALAANGFWNAVAVGVAIALVGQVEGHVLQPLILGKHVSLHPIVVGVGVSAGTVVAGILGAIVAVPVIGVTWAVFSALRTPPEPDDVPAEQHPGDGTSEAVAALA
ncbi:hypothetical protein CSO01_26310 [Cellulomonas soli]|uniref:AI-2E family transporter n=1 Tax=Cellulomonas soli TaxID=931535 RepID=A0A512PFF6_9CELL|nr:hypothetical protein CSO01_26310 [Cellulomonas soli]